MIAVISGSKNDQSTIEPVLETFKKFPIKLNYYVASAHRSPEKLHQLIKNLDAQGVSVIIAVAGHAAHLGGVIAAQTLTPVYGVPLATSELHGIDSLYSMVMMPGGIPVATFGHGKAGIKNAILMACAHLAKSDENLKTILTEYRKAMAEAIPGEKPVWSHG
jgi:5-(carboxyamino)imidazole ribonucleotide mutase